MTQSEAESIIGKKVREVLLSKKKKTFVLQIEGAVVSDESIIDDTCLTDTISFHQRTRLHAIFIYQYIIIII